MSLPQRRDNEKGFLPLDYLEANAFLCRLDPAASAFTFQTFDDNAKRRDATLVDVIHGTLADAWERLARLNARGAGIFVTINETDLTSRRAEHIVSVRATWADLDEGWPPDDFPLAPSIVVSTSPDRWQVCWMLADEMSHDDHAGIMARLVKDYGSDNNAKDIARVLRLPGFYHRKGAPQLVRIDEDSDRRYSRDAILTAFPPLPAGSTAATASPATAEPQRYDVSLEAVRSALEHIPADGRWDWLKMGMAIKHQFGESGYAAWGEWSARCEGKFDPADQKRVWGSIQRSGQQDGKLVTVGSLLKQARENGWKGHQTDPADEFPTIGPPTTPAIAPQGPLTEGSADIDIDEIIKWRMSALIKGILHPGEQAVMYADPGAGKSFVALDLAWHVAQGKPWHGRKVKQAPVLYVALEGVEGFRGRMKVAEMTHGPAPWLRRQKAHVSLIREKAGEQGMATVLAAVKETADLCGQPAGLIIIDTLARAMAGDDENSAKDVMHFVDHRAGEIARKTGAAVLTLAHTNKLGSLRGSLTLSGAVNVVLKVERNEDNRTLTGEKVKDGDGVPLFDFTLRKVVLATDADGDDADSCVIEATPPKPRTETKRMSKAASHFCQTANAIRLHAMWDEPRTPGSKVEPVEPDVRLADVKKQFMDSYPSDGEQDPKKLAAAKRQAWKSVMDADALPGGFERFNRDGVEYVRKGVEDVRRGSPTDPQDEFDRIEPEA